MEGGVAPGEDFPVFECDFGVLGMQICFDVCVPKGWQVLGRKGVDIVAWPTQSPQTVLPSQYAFKHGYYVVSSTWRNNASLFAPTGLTAGRIEQPEEDPGPSDRSELRPASLAAGAAQREGTVREVR
jgi:carbohydrate-selective porin OprB